MLNTGRRPFASLLGLLAPLARYGVLSLGCFGRRLPLRRVVHGGGAYRGAEGFLACATMSGPAQFLEVRGQVKTLGSIEASQHRHWKRYSIRELPLPCSFGTTQTRYAGSY